MFVFVCVFVCVCARACVLSRVHTLHEIYIYVWVQVIPSRILMAVPNMGVTPIIIDIHEKRGLFLAYPFLNMPLTTLLTG